MLALDPRVVEAVWAAVGAYLPERPPVAHPLGCHRPRISDRDCFEGILFRLVTGCSWAVAGRIGKAGETTLRTRCNEWMRAGVFAKVVNEAIAGIDRIIGLSLDEVALDSSSHKAPMGGEGTGPNVTDRCKQGWKWSLLTDGQGIPIGWEIAAANRHDSKLVAATLDDAASRGLICDIGTVLMDRGYAYPFVTQECAERGLTDVIIPPKRKPKMGRRRKPVPAPIGNRWTVERTNSWLSNFGQLRRSTDRWMYQRREQLSLAVTLILTVKLIKWANRWQPKPT